MVMNMENIYIDELTNIHNEKYLNDNYHNYIDDNSNFIMIDITKFKRINDIFGHDIGDDYLCLMSKILKDNFKDSIVVRLHGDEFVVVTKYNEEDIIKTFKTCYEQITEATNQTKVPREFTFNAGIAPCTNNLDESKENADYMMYYGKNNNISIQTFSDEILNLKIKQDDYLENIDSHLGNHDFSYSVRKLFDKNGEETNLLQLYTKSRNGDSILKHDEYEFLRNTSRIFRLDMNNIKFILENINLEETLIIMVDYKSLLLNDEIIKYLYSMRNNLSNIIISIDINKINESYFKELSEIVDVLKYLGIKVRLDNFSSSVGDTIFENSNIDYIKILSNDWKKRIGNYKLQKTIEIKNHIFHELGIIPIYDNVTNKDEYEFLKSINQDDMFMLGNYFSDEKKLILK